jgi:histidinol-phosphate aminotransferase
MGGGRCSGYGARATRPARNEVLEALGHHLARQGGPGGEIVYSNPGYTALVEAAQAYGGVGAPVPLDAQLGNDLPALRARIGPRTRAVFLVNPHNPSGTLNEAAALHEFVAQAARHVAVVVDEAYLELAPDFAERSLARQVAPGGRVIVFRTFTKFFGLAALPLGYAILPIELAGTLRQQGLGAARAQSRLAVVVAARASLSDTTYQERVRRAVGSERERWFEVLDSLGLRRTRAAGNFVFFRSGRPHAKVASALAERGIDIGRAFPPLDDWARISIGLPEENARAQQALRQIFAR